VPKRGSREFIDNFGSVTRCLRAVAGEAYAAFEVGTAQAKLLRHIGSAGRISQADLARATQTAPTLTGRALETLVRRGWVRRKRSEEDRREYELELTAAGHRIRDQVEEARDGIVTRVAAVLDAEDCEDFDRIAKKILGAFGESGRSALPDRADHSAQRPDPDDVPGR
jgi:DNA-binding MarR family transcriptional regulator